MWVATVVRLSILYVPFVSKARLLYTGRRVGGRVFDSKRPASTLPYLSVLAYTCTPPLP